MSTKAHIDAIVHNFYQQQKIKLNADIKRHIYNSLCYNKKFTTVRLNFTINMTRQFLLCMKIHFYCNNSP